MLASRFGAGHRRVVSDPYIEAHNHERDILCYRPGCGPSGWADTDRISVQYPRQYNWRCEPVSRIETDVRGWNLPSRMNILCSISKCFFHRKYPSGTKWHSVEVEVGIYAVISRLIHQFREVPLNKNIYNALFTQQITFPIKRRSNCSETDNAIIMK
jgi:hypothetical protein